jgi:hypothetical protein
MKYTKEEKQKYFQDLRARWFKSKELANNDETAKALYQEVNGKFSYYSFYFTLMDMRARGYDGIPYVDCKTFNGWKEAGFKVMKGAKSRISGIVWLGVKDDNNSEDDDFVYPKLYHLFHRSQVEERKS